MLVIRSFNNNNQPEFLAVNTANFNTEILNAKTVNKAIKLKNSETNNIDKVFSVKLLKFGTNLQEVYLTVDMCQSSKPSFEKDFFETLIKYGKEHNEAINVTVTLSGLWVKHHPLELKQLIAYNNDGSLNITWANHSYYHYYNYKLPNDENFMIHDKDNAKNDIIQNEIYMLENGVTPSVLFRFPGLIYNDYLLNTLKSLDLVPLDANAWLAKTGGKFSAGDIILVHGNKNEHIGIKLFLKDLEDNKFNNLQFGKINNLLIADHNK